MGISDRLLGKKNVNGKPHIEAVHPSAALPGGEVRIVGSGLRPIDLRPPRVRFGEASPARSPSHRRVLHIEYAANELPNGLNWFDRR